MNASSMLDNMAMEKQASLKSRQRRAAAIERFSVKPAVSVDTDKARAAKLRRAANRDFEEWLDRPVATPRPTQPATQLTQNNVALQPLRSQTSYNSQPAQNSSTGTVIMLGDSKKALPASMGTADNQTLRNRAIDLEPAPQQSQYTPHPATQSQHSDGPAYNQNKADLSPETTQLMMDTGGIKGPYKKQSIFSKVKTNIESRRQAKQQQAQFADETSISKRKTKGDKVLSSRNGEFAPAVSVDSARKKEMAEFRKSKPEEYYNEALRANLDRTPQTTPDKTLKHLNALNKGADWVRDNPGKAALGGAAALAGTAALAYGIHRHNQKKKEEENNTQQYSSPYAQPMYRTASSYLDDLVFEKQAVNEVEDVAVQIPEQVVSDEASMMDKIVEAVKYNKPQITPGGKATPSKFVQRKNKERFRK